MRNVSFRAHLVLVRISRSIFRLCRAFSKSNACTWLSCKWKQHFFQTNALFLGPRFSSFGILANSCQYSPFHLLSFCSSSYESARLLLPHSFCNCFDLFLHFYWFYWELCEKGCSRRFFWTTVALSMLNTNFFNSAHTVRNFYTTFVIEFNLHKILNKILLCPKFYMSWI